jgi:hypothetical protein
VVLSGEERRRWRELARQLRHDRRLAARVMLFRVVSGCRHDRAIARVGTAMPAVTWVPATGAAVLGLILVAAGALVRSGGLVIAGTSILVAALILAGITLVATGIAGTSHAPATTSAAKP